MYFSLRKRLFKTFEREEEATVEVKYFISQELFRLFQKYFTGILSKNKSVHTPLVFVGYFINQSSNVIQLG